MQFFDTRICEPVFRAVRELRVQGGTQKLRFAARAQ